MDIEQGSIIFGLKSKKYPEQPCYGIVITASCDIANQKVEEIYYVTAVNVKDWLFSKLGHALVIKHKRQGLYDKIRQQVCSQQLDESLLVNFTLDEVKKVIDETVANAKTRKDILSDINKYLDLISNDTIEKRKSDVQLYSRDCSKLLEQIGKGDHYRYVYLTEQAYLANTKKDDGLIVDFQEINCLSIEQMRQVVDGQIDYMVQKDHFDNLQKLQLNFWLKNENDFAMVYSKISSPWREHLMQRFAHYFTRIGLDGAETQDYKKISEKIK